MTADPSFIPFNRPSLAGRELEYIQEAIGNGHISGNGAFTKQAERELARISGSHAALMTTSCTHALELSSRILNLGPGDEVIVPAYTFVSTAAAFALSGAKPIFVDVTPQTLNLDLEGVEAAITPRTRAVATVHYAGIADQVDRLANLCASHEIPLVEDNAHGFAAKYGGRPLGTWGALSTLSFHETKNITCGEGGALTINDPSLVERAEILREKGTDRARFLRGQVDKYTWVEVGSSWVASDILAAYLVAQLEEFDAIQRDRMALWQAYDESLLDWAAEHGVRRPHVPALVEHAAHMYYLQFQDLDQRTRFIEHLKKLGILAVFHYQALNVSDVGRQLGGRPGQCPVSENAANTLVRLPFFRDIQPIERDRVISAVQSFVP